MNLFTIWIAGIINSKFALLIKASIVSALIACVLGGAFYLNVLHEQNIQLQQQLQLQLQLQLEQDKQKRVGVVLDTTANIIKRDGKLSLTVAKKYANWIYEAGLKYNVDPLLILSVMSVESGFKYNAISPTGPIGLLQIAASWHKEKTTKAALFNPKHNIHVGAQILNEYSRRSKTETETLLRYNGSFGKSNVYAIKVLSKKTKYENEIIEAMVKSI